MTLEKHEAVMCEALCLFNLFRNMGYEPDNLFFFQNGSGSVGIAIRYHGYEYRERVGDVLGAPEEVKERWLKIAYEWQDGVIPDEEMECYWQASEPKWRKSLQGWSWQDCPSCRIS